MNGEKLWDQVISKLQSRGEDFKTLKQGLWFRASSDGFSVYIDKAIDNKPSSGITSQRKISKKDFMLVNSYYDRWINGEVGIRHEVSRKSRNTAYIFALIEVFK